MDRKILDNMDFKKSGGLVPAIVQDFENGEVLMLAYVNRESLERTIETGKTWFWSRSRNKLLIEVKQVGAACHTGRRSCFYRKLY